MRRGGFAAGAARGARRAPLPNPRGMSQRTVLALGRADAAKPGDMTAFRAPARSRCALAASPLAQQGGRGAPPFQTPCPSQAARHSVEEPPDRMPGTSPVQALLYSQSSS